jgi:hypothetical protein
MLLSRHQNAGQNQDINIGSRCFENVAQFRYFQFNSILIYLHANLTAQGQLQSENFPEFYGT